MLHLHIFSLFWLLAMPPYIFLVVLGLRTILDYLMDHSDSWWALPLWMSIAFPTLMMLIIGFLYILYLSFGP